MGAYVATTVGASELMTDDAEEDGAVADGAVAGGGAVGAPPAQPQVEASKGSCEH